ncbi:MULTISPECIES: UTRA domain-containing protein [Salinispora]|uniref:UbiC transcription regulator-associated domain protein n=2 Tax=Salinispora TaxID=168694 RepID=A4X179_SALTO|nr:MULTISPECIES: UTRA domain-containing protein [Salinispora]ABP52629.1 UbiC transcription regulator-associated domain protein [Salinispora tropica CNB-440]
MGGSDWLSVSMPYVQPDATHAGDVWAADAAGQGRSGTQRILAVGEVVAAAEVAAALRVAPGDPVTVRRRLMLLDDEPVELTDSYYPVAIARGTALAEQRKIRGGAVRLLAEVGYRPRRVREDVYTRLPEPAERRLLGLADHEWALGLTRVLSTQDDVPVEVSVMTMVPWGRRLRYELAID